MTVRMLLVDRRLLGAFHHRGSFTAVAAAFPTFAAVFPLRTIAAFRPFAARWPGADLLSDVGAGGLVDDAHRELDLAALVEADDLHLHRIAVVDHIGGLGDAALGELADVHQPVTRTEEVDEGAEIRGLHHLADVDHADFRLRHDAADPVDRPLRLLDIAGGDGDGAVVVDVDLALGLLDDLADHLAAGADDLADLLLRHAHGGDARRGGGDVVPGAGQRLGHLAQDVQPPIPRLLQRDLHDVGRDGRDLDVHLQAGDALLGARDLEVHVAEV